MTDTDPRRPRQARLYAALADCPLDALVASTPANVAYASGYRGMSALIYHGYTSVAISIPGRTVLVAPCGDAPAALASGLAPEDFVPVGRAFFESPDGLAAETRLAERNLTLAEAVREAMARLTIAENATIGVDALELGDLFAPRAVVDGTSCFRALRQLKVGPEVACLERAAQLAETGIQRALCVAGPGWTERQIAAVIGQTMLEGGGQPRFLSVQVGERGALSDAFATDKPWQPGQLLRMDVGCDVEGYWSDLARTAVLGEPTPLQRTRFDALLAGQQAEVQAVRPGARASDLFDLAVATTRAAGLPGYRRHHTGHAIGLDIYEPPSIGPGVSDALAAGMVLCLETPFYEIGWGGILTEDTVLVTPDGCRSLSTSSRELRIVPV